MMPNVCRVDIFSKRLFVSLRRDLTWCKIVRIQFFFFWVTEKFNFAWGPGAKYSWYPMPRKVCWLLKLSHILVLISVFKRDVMLVGS